MIRYVLDTDHLSLLERGHQTLKPRLERVPAELIAISVVTFEEQIRGRLAQVKRAARGPALVQAYRWLRETDDFLHQLTIIDFDDDAALIDESLRRHKVRIGTQDRRIAAIVLARNCILVTRNQADFSQVPGLALEDWSK